MPSHRECTHLPWKSCHDSIAEFGLVTRFSVRRGTSFPRFSLPFSGPAIGVVLLLPGLQSDTVRSPVAVCADFLLSHLSLLFVPVDVGMMTRPSLVSQYGARMLLVVVASTSAGLLVTVLMLHLDGRLPGRCPAGHRRALPHLFCGRPVHPFPARPCGGGTGMATMVAARRTAPGSAAACGRSRWCCGQRIGIVAGMGRRLARRSYPVACAQICHRTGRHGYCGKDRRNPCAGGCVCRGYWPRGCAQRQIPV